MGRKGNDGRQRLIDAAFQCFADIGYEQSTSRMIAETAGVALGLIHRHFENKRGLLAATDEQYDQWSRRRSAQALRQLITGVESFTTTTEDELHLAYFRQALLSMRPGARQLVHNWLQMCEEELQRASQLGAVCLTMPEKETARALLTLEVGSVMLQRDDAANAALQQRIMLTIMQQLLGKQAAN